MATKFCMPGVVQDVITPANFFEDRLRGFCVANGRILAFSIDLLRQLMKAKGLCLAVTFAQSKTVLQRTGICKQIPKCLHICHDRSGMLTTMVNYH